MDTLGGYTNQLGARAPDRFTENYGFVGIAVRINR